MTDATTEAVPTFGGRRSRSREAVNAVLKELGMVHTYLTNPVNGRQPKVDNSGGPVFMGSEDGKTWRRVRFGPGRSGLVYDVEDATYEGETGHIAFLRRAAFFAARRVDSLAQELSQLREARDAAEALLLTARRRHAADAAYAAHEFGVGRTEPGEWQVGGDVWTRAVGWWHRDANFRVRETITYCVVFASGSAEVVGQSAT